MKRFLVAVSFILPGLFVRAQHTFETIDSLIINASFEEALKLTESTDLQKTEDRVLLLNKKVEALIGMGRLSDAQEVLSGMLSVTDPFLNAITETNRGALLMHQGRNDLAIEKLEGAFQQFSSLDKGNTLEAAETMTLLGLVYKFTGKHSQAEEQMRMALSIRKEMLPEDHELIAASYNNLGLIYTNIDNDRALDYYEQAGSIYRKRHGEGHPKTAISFTNTGLVYSLLELYGDAINNYESALKIWEKVYPSGHQSTAFVLFNLGNIYRSLGNTNSARQYYDKALAMYRAVYGENHPEIAGVLNALGNLALTDRKYDEALSLFQNAIIANAPTFETRDVSVNPELRDYYHGLVLLYSLMYKAQALEARHLGKTLKFADLDLALNTLKLCDALIDDLRQQSRNESDKLALGMVATEVYEDGVRIAHEAALVAWKKRPYQELAFYFAEKSKSAVLLEAISDTDAKSFAGIPPELLEEERALKSAIALTAQSLAQRPSAEEEDYLRQTLFALNRNYEAFVARLERDYPSYFNLKFNMTSPSVRELQHLIDPQTALISYFIEEKSRRLYVFTVTHDRFKIDNHHLSDDFEKFFAGLRNGLFYNVPEIYIRSANVLSRVLVPANIPGSVENLVIIPSGPLSVIPFETLLTKKTSEQSSYTSLPYLLKDYTIRYEFSAGLLQQKSRKQGTNTASVFLCAPVNFPDNSRLTALPGTEAEVKEIANLLASRSIDHRVLVHQDANEHMIKTQALRGFDVLHFATHGLVDEDNPALSRIFLQQHSEAEDGSLYTSEIYNLELDANLVTLSACETGLGKISKGEGVIGLSRALVYAGAKNLVVSFWKVADESTAEMMKTFYDEMLQHPAGGYFNHLRDAKLKLMANPSYAAPYYWAPFILIGY